MIKVAIGGHRERTGDRGGCHHDDIDAFTLLAQQHGLPPAQIRCANGSVALIQAIARACLSPGDRALVIGPTFSEYAAAVQAVGGSVSEVLTTSVQAVLDAIHAQDPALVFLCNPNNPTGHHWPDEEVDQIAAAAPLHFKNSTLKLCFVL